MQPAEKYVKERYVPKKKDILIHRSTGKNTFKKMDRGAKQNRKEAIPPIIVSQQTPSTNPGGR